MKFRRPEFKALYPGGLYKGGLYKGLYTGGPIWTPLLAIPLGWALWANPIWLGPLCAGAAIGLLAIYALWPWGGRIYPIWRRGMGPYASPSPEVREAGERLIEREALKRALAERA